ncbi:MAG: diaminopimelate epimerase [Candidatus Omnitrophica bacterium]|nr:diaminopimelate epimerase [Candidatus Omnitrophota bacterium]
MYEKKAKEKKQAKKAAVKKTAGKTFQVRKSKIPMFKKEKNFKKKTKAPAAPKKRKFDFTKMVASGNDFIVFDNRRSDLKSGSEIAMSLCPRTTGIGADGLIFIEKSKKADFKMRIFNPDGSEAQMCGNGIRCAVLYKAKKNTSIETLAGFLSAEIQEDGIKVKMTDPKDLQLNVDLDIDGRFYQVNYVNTGVPHAVYFVEDLDSTNIRILGRLFRYHRQFEPEGTNVDFEQILDQGMIGIRTYERGVEAETLACGTGSVASALIYHHKFVGVAGNYMVKVQTKGDEILRVYFDYKDGNFENVWLKGKARIVYKGECYV